MESLDLLLVSMPFSPIALPHAAVGVLCGAAKRAGLSSRGTYPCFRLADRLGVALYTAVAENCVIQRVARDDFPGEWIFASWSNPARPSVWSCPDDEPFLGLEVAPRFEMTPRLADQFSRVRLAVREFLLSEVERALAMKPRIVGCSSTFIQQSSSLAFLRAIKEREPSITTIIGGANCEGEMGFEMVLQFPWIDYVFSGEADASLPTLCRDIMQSAGPVPTARLPYGVYDRAKAESQASIPETDRQYEISSVEDLTTIGAPDFDDYFAERDESTVRNWVRVCSVEAGRGCQKGERATCNFCGLNGERAHYRRKDDQEFWDELLALSEHYSTKVFVLTDNILGVESFDGWLKLAARNPTLCFALEVRSTLNEEQVKALAAAGVFQVQPGIESLDDHLLQLMNKGNSVLKNLAFLKYLKEQSIGAWWNVLYEIPGEQTEDYLRLAELFPLLHHLPPPMSFSKIRFSKFSPYHRTPGKFGLKLRASDAFRVMYPRVSDSALNRLAFCFLEEKTNGGTPEQLTEAKQLMLWRAAEWRHEYSVNRSDRCPPVLSMRALNGIVRIHDTRSCAISPLYIMDETESAVYQQIRTPQTVAGICQALSDKGSQQSFDRVEACLDYFLKHKLSVERGARHLALATYTPIPISANRQLGLRYLFHYTEEAGPDAYQKAIDRLFVHD